MQNQHTSTSTTEPEGWFVAAIRDGLMGLALLSLENTPPLAVIPTGVTMAWSTAIWPGSTWNKEADEPRIIQAFQRLRKNTHRWPPPSQFIAMLPPRPQAPTSQQITHQRWSETARLEAMKKISEILKNSE